MSYSLSVVLSKIHLLRHKSVLSTFCQKAYIVVPFALSCFHNKLVGEPENSDQGHTKSQRGRQGKL